MTPVDHDGLTFNCRLDGPESAPWIVFSNSLATDLTLWDHQVEALAPTHRILRYDQRGHGGTSIPQNPATLDQLAADALALMAHFGVQHATFVGCSMGAATGFALAPRHPGRIARLVASDGQAATAPGGAQAWADRIAAARTRGMAEFADATIQRWFAPASHAESNPAIPRTRAMIAATPLEGFVACARALQSYDVTPTLPGIAQPTLLIAGARDGAMPATMQALAHLIPASRYVEIPEAGHLPCIERPAAFTAALQAFLQ